MENGAEDFAGSQPPDLLGIHNLALLYAPRNHSLKRGSKGLVCGEFILTRLNEDALWVEGVLIMLCWCYTHVYILEIHREAQIYSNLWQI